MSFVVVGTIAYDSVATIAGEAKEVLGGSASYCSFAASFFTRTKIVGTVGKDFSASHMNLFKKHSIDTEGIDKVDGLTFRWKGKYSHDFDEAFTIETHLNVLQNAKIALPESYKKCAILFLANIDPEIQLEVLSQMKQVKFIAMDTMNFWITSKLELLKKLFRRVNLLCINEGEARMLSGEKNIIKAAKKIMKMGPSILIIKRGSYGALLFHDTHICSVPAFPLEEVVDPTGAGDSFAGGLLGYLSTRKNINIQNLRKALGYGNIVASFTVEGFSVNKLASITRTEIEHRYKLFKEITALS